MGPIGVLTAGLGFERGKVNLGRCHKLIPEPKALLSELHGSSTILRYLHFTFRTCVEPQICFQAPSSVAVGQQLALAVQPRGCRLDT